MFFVLFLRRSPCGFWLAQKSVSRIGGKTHPNPAVPEIILLLLDTVVSVVIDYTRLNIWVLSFLIVDVKKSVRTRSFVLIAANHYFLYPSFPWSQITKSNSSNSWRPNLVRRSPPHQYLVVRGCFFVKLSASCKVRKCLIGFSHTVHIVFLFHSWPLIFWNAYQFLA